MINWIEKNQSSSGMIYWDEKKNFDAWDHFECLTALAILGRKDSFLKGLNWFLDNLSKDNQIFSSYKGKKITQNYYELHHAIYFSVPLLQGFYIFEEIELLKKNFDPLKKIVEKTINSRDNYGFFYWAEKDGEFQDNSLISATSSIYLSLKASIEIYKFLKKDTKLLEDIIKSIEQQFTGDMSRFNRDGVDRSRFSMDAYYPYLAGINLDNQTLLDSLSDFYVPGMGIKCVKEEPWVTFAESSEAIISLIRVGEIEFAKKIMSEIENFKNKEGIFPTGYQFSEKIFWPDERSTWTNAAYIIAKDCLYDLTQKKKAILV
tara:strand:+ start:621 stop:1574 length:954 start_codon:yes stop_codon:yes gene_type:complete